MPSSIRLGLHYHTPFRQTADGLFMPGPFGCFVDSLAENCREVICLLHEAPASRWQECDYQIRAANVTCVNLGEARSVPYRALFAAQFIRRARPHFRSMDLLLVRAPSPLLPQLARAARPLPLAFLIVGDYLAGINDLPQPFWRKELIRLWARWNTFGQQNAMKHALNFVNSQKLHDELRPKAPHLHLTRTTTLKNSDFYERQDTCQNRPVRLLYVGRMSVIKGLFDMVTALSMLVKSGEDVSLDLVGPPESGELDTIEKVLALAGQLGIAERVHYLGRKPLGPELFDCYRSADLFVNATPSSEGFPRTLWEAMANSLPVIATRVGSIPDFVAGAAELAPPRDPSALAAAIERLIHDPALRQRYIRAGQLLARENTLEQRAREMVDVMWTYLVKGDPNP